MNVNRVIEVHDQDPLAAVRSALGAWWQQTGLDALLAPVELPDGSGTRCEALRDPARLEAVNPFAPVMGCNAAAAIGKFSREHPGARLAAVLRPCELRALIELRKRRYGAAADDRVLTIGVDCPATLAPEPFAARARQSGLAALTREALQSAAEGEPWPARPRPACQVCLSPAPRGADLAIGFLGLPAERLLLLIARDEATDAANQLDHVAPTLASEALVVQRESTVGGLDQRRSRARAELARAATRRFSDLGSVMAWLAGCTLCGDCLDACPLYDGELSGLLGLGSSAYPGQAALAELVEASRWLASCSGCGMCETACSCEVPLSQLICGLSHRIQEELDYVPGDPSRRLPWMAA